MHRLLLLLIVAVTALPMSGAPLHSRLRGLVRDSISHQPVPYAAIFLKGSDRGGLADENGIFDISTDKPFSVMQVSAMGYTTKLIPVKRGVVTDIVVDISPDGVALGEVVVKPKKEKYSKRNNPAVDFMHRIVDASERTDPKRHDNFNYTMYERITMALDNFNPESTKNVMLKRYDFLKEYVDTSEISGKPILNLNSREKAARVFYRRDPRTEKVYVDGIRQEGLGDFMDQDNMRIFFEDILREIDVYDNDINILQNRFVSPLSRLAPDFYKFYLSDTVMVGDERCIELSFVPRNSKSFGFTGRIYVPEGDSTMFIKKVVMNVPKEINLNFISHIYFEQNFVKAPDGSRLKVSDDMTAEVSILPGTQGLYVRRNTAYTGHNFNAPAYDRLFSPLGREIVASGAEERDAEFWNKARLIPISGKEDNVGLMLARLRQQPLYYWTEKVIKIAFTGYISTGNPSKVDIGPMNTVISHNTMEGYRLRAGGMTTANLCKRFFGRGYVAYGTHDHKWKYRGEVEWAFNDKKYHAREFPIHSLRAYYMYDTDMLGQHYAFTNPDNMFLSFKRQKDLQMTYHRVGQLEYTLELRNNFSVVGGLRYERQYATEFMTFIIGYGDVYPHYSQASFSLQLRYAPGEKFYQTKTHRYPINLDAPVVMVTQTYSPKGFMGSMFEINKTEISLQKRFWMSAFGFTDIILKGGHVWSRSAYPDLLIPNANLSYTIQPESFSLMNAMEFINDSYAAWDFTYWANGAILNYIPLLNKLKLREAFSFRGIWGHLSKRNNPEYNDGLFRFPEVSHTMAMKHTPYMEAGVGLDNIFKILRVDYVWRLTYRDNPGIDRSGVRIALHVTF
ncbi:MAG: DUF5686 and carboxypeptidase regulatory-like domain-containing protein [Muribaculaceae bacterium]|nr:DUF5686 and carboxypeptidase regulatory-like domain-containing protein [Muribaculaceae bacterium]